MNLVAPTEVTQGDVAGHDAHNGKKLANREVAFFCTLLPLTVEKMEHVPPGNGPPLWTPAILDVYFPVMLVNNTQFPGEAGADGGVDDMFGFGM